MKRCPECEFLYEDDQKCCDMDGTRLLYTTTLPPLPEDVAAPKSVWGALAIPLLAGLVLTAVLFILYHASPLLLNSPTRSQPPKPAGQPMPPGIKDTRSEPAQVVQPSPNTSVSTESPEEPTTVPTTPAKTKSSSPGAKPSPSPAVNQVPKPVSHVQVAPDPRLVAPATSSANQPSVTNGATANQPPGNNQKPVATSTSSHPRPPTVNPSPKPTNQNQNSKVNSFFKKAGRILKKPFDQ